MDFADQIRAIASNAQRWIDVIQTEEATKTSLVQPFIQALGYNINDPTEVVPEFTADVGIKKGEKVDYAVQQDGVPILLFECKFIKTDLSRITASQLYRYFSVTRARFGIMTNGVQYRFFSDLDETNRMDAAPFLEVNFMELRDQDIEELRKFAKGAYDEDNILASANDLKYTRKIKKILGDQLTNPDEEFVKFFTSKVYDGHKTAQVKQQFTKFVKDAFKEFVHERISARLSSALAQEADLQTEQDPESDGNTDIVTTNDELEGYYIAKSIVSTVVSAKRVAIRDTQSYCGVLLDDNNRKPICRLRFNASSQKYLGVFDENKNETRIPIDDVHDIYDHAETLRASAARYISPQGDAATSQVDAESSDADGSANQT